MQQDGSSAEGQQGDHLLEQFPPPNSAAGQVSEPLPRFLLAPEPIVLSPGRPRVELMVTNTGDRPVQVGSHFHFFEVNRALRFDRAAGFGTRLDIPAGTSDRFEPGDSRPVTLVSLGGSQRAMGFNALVEGSVSQTGSKLLAKAAIDRAVRGGFLTDHEPESPE